MSAESSRHLQGLSLMTDGSKCCSLRSAQILVDRRNVQLLASCLLLQHTLHAHIEGDPFILLPSGTLIIFGFWVWKASYWVSALLLKEERLI